MADFETEVEDIITDAMLRNLSPRGQVMLFQKSLGVLGKEGVLSHKEAAFFFLSVYRDANQTRIAKEFDMTPQQVSAVLAKAEKKIREGRSAGKAEEGSLKKRWGASTCSVDGGIQWSEGQVSGEDA